ncbi:ABC transporter permease [Phytoactinopolyspora alkaliphila]|uniref:ABC transporter permease n=1 Tax=Phytoactinopolyspora alkaliphila TaxID=1783498 RepID=A0A6N9YS68_9ACTN|nr:ABC transporter permease [Phytoactinopolyspora alkaliphila]NED97822.1 ABC transporter permease [Phytoactinopolyspora alkaliphila]
MAVPPGRLAVRRFMRHRLAVVGLVVLVLMGLATLVLPLIVTTDPNAVDPTAFRRPPSSEHPLGTDSAGRDVLARLIAGGQISLLVGLIAAFGATVIGMTLGAVAGYFGGWVDATISRLTDVVLSFPTLIVVIIVVAFVGPSLTTLVLAIALFDWPTACRVVRGLTMSLRAQDSITGVIGLGAGPLRILRKHVVPTVVAPLTVVATILVAQAIMLEAALSFLGLGVPPPSASWGNMLNEAQSLSILESMPWLWLPPGLAIALTVLAVNFVGDGLRDAVDPRTTR